MGEGEQPGGKQADEDVDLEQAGGDEAYFADLPLGAAWGETITKGRATELEAMLQAWKQEADHSERSGPFEGAALSGGDVFWLVVRTLAGTGDDKGVKRMKEGYDLATKGRPPLLGAMLSDLNLVGADLHRASLQQSAIGGANLVRADLSGANLVEADLSGANLVRARLSEANLVRARLSRANLSGANLTFAKLMGADLNRANLTKADLTRANVTEADLTRADLTSAYLREVTVGGADLSEATFAGADLRSVRMNVETNLSGTRVSTSTRLADVIWNAVSLALVAWESLPVVGDEMRARKRISGDWKKDRATRLAEYEAAVRSYRLLAVTLRSQGLNEHADRYAYRAQLMQRVVLRRKRHWLRWFGSLLLWMIAGYGYRPLRTLFWYLAVLGAFAFAYFQATHGALTFGLPRSQVQPLAWYESLVLSVSSFHGRGFFQPVQSLGDPVTILAAMEAVFGLFIEVSFIATFTQRYFGK